MKEKEGKKRQKEREKKRKKTNDISIHFKRKRNLG